ncbi:COM1 regulatory protein [Diplocarpon rosae]|nr:COM1 regulatory protein [Diplocarpon rosae]
MPSLLIPESGMSLGVSSEASSKPASGAPDAIGLTLTDAMVEEMIKCVQNGKNIQLSLGEHPSISYGAKIQHLASSHDPFAHDLYRTTTSSNDSELEEDMYKSKKPNPRKGMVRVEPKTNTSWIASLGVNFKPTKVIPKASTKSAVAVSSQATHSSDDPDSLALAQLKGSLASEKQSKDSKTTKVIDSLVVPGRKGGSAQKATNKSKFLSQNRALASGTTRSMPTSPALNGVGSPSLGPTSIPLSQQNAEKLKEARKPVIHLLAVEPLTESSIANKLPDLSETDLSNSLRKVGDVNETTGKWELRKAFWKELDVWNFKYTGDDRQRAIENAVKQYDKMRMGISEPEWDRLLIKSERGTGKSLSKLQAEIVAKGNLARGSKNGEGSGRDTPNGGEDDLLDDKNLSKVKGEGRSTSQPPTTKPKKTSEKEAQAKRLFSKNPGKAASKAAPKAAPKAASKAASKATSKAATKATSKAAPAKKQASVPKAGAKVLSSEYVEDSDEDDVQTATAPTLKPKPKQALKRSREEDERDTSDSSMPMSKRVKKDVPVSNNRISDAGQKSRTNSNSFSSLTSYKNKSNSPRKSSPLASSPPANASDIESSGDRTSFSASPAGHISTKNSRSPIYKRHQKSSSVTSSNSSNSQVKPEAIELARKYKRFYPAYLRLFKEVVAEGENRTRSKEKDLLDMHERLEDWRKQIALMVHEI